MSDPTFVDPASMKLEDPVARERPPSVADAVPAHDDPEDVLSASPFEQDMRSALAAAPKERSRPSLTLVLICGVLLAAGFAGGIEVNKHWGTPGPPSGMPDGGNGRGMAGGPGARESGAGGRQAMPGGGATVGTVKVVSQGTLYVETMDGSVVTVETGDATRVQVSKAGKVSDLKPGAEVTVQGTGDASGKVTATTITQGAPGSRSGS